MKYEDLSAGLDAKVHSGFTDALELAEDYAKSIAPKRTGRYAESIQHSGAAEDGHGLHSHLGATVSSARAKELGAYITAKRAPRLVFDAGNGVRTAEAVRLPARPVMLRVTREWQRLVGDALRRRLP